MQSFTSQSQPLILDVEFFILSETFDNNSPPPHVVEVSKNLIWPKLSLKQTEDLQTGRVKSVEEEQCICNN